MNNNEKKQILADELNFPQNISEDTLLSGLKMWDSMAILTFILILDDRFGKKVEVEQIRHLKNVSDLMDMMC